MLWHVSTQSPSDSFGHKAWKLFWPQRCRCEAFRIAAARQDCCWIWGLPLECQGGVLKQSLPKQFEQWIWYIYKLVMFFVLPRVLLGHTRVLASNLAVCQHEQNAFGRASTLGALVCRTQMQSQLQELEKVAEEALLAKCLVSNVSERRVDVGSAASEAKSITKTLGAHCSSLLSLPFEDNLRLRKDLRTLAEEFGKASWALRILSDM